MSHRIKHVGTKKATKKKNDSFFSIKKKVQCSADESVFALLVNGNAK